MTPTIRSIPVEYIKQCIEYREEVVDGVLQGNVYWKHREDMPNNWNGRYAGKKAGSKNNAGYYTIYMKYNGKQFCVRSHNFIWVLCENRYPHDNMVIDHIDRNKINNLKENLRELNQYQNTLNSNPSDNKTSAYKGVRYKYCRKTWEVRASKNKKSISKCAKDEIEAAILYNEEIIKLHGSQFVFLNDISMGYTNKEYPNMPRHYEPEKVAA